MVLPHQGRQHPNIYGENTILCEKHTGPHRDLVSCDLAVFFESNNMQSTSASTRRKQTSPNLP